VILFRCIGEREEWLDGIKPGLRNGVEPTLAKGLTPAEPVQTEVAALE
jgi:hypothetical protein